MSTWRCSPTLVSLAIPLLNLPRSRYWWAIVLCVTLGALLRWLQLSGKVFWHDEVYTALREVGFQGNLVEPSLFTGLPFTAATLQQYQTFEPESTFADTWRSLLGNPEHPPLFYVLEWGWVKLFGPSITAFRSLSVVLSWLTFPAVVGFARDLFGKRQPAVVIALLLFATSPVQVLYAQEAREYSLWTGLTVLSSWLLLRAVQQSTRRNWLLYVVATALLFYTSLLSALVALAHSLYALVVLPRRRWWTFATAMAAAGLLFAPWLLTLLIQADRFNKVTAWTLDAFPRDLLVKLWGLHFSALLIDPSLPLNHPYTYLVPPLVLVLIGVSLYGCWRQLPPTTAWLLIMLTVVPTTVLIGSDLLRGSRLSSETRYFFPAMTAAQLAIAGWLGLQLQNRRRVTAFCLVGLVSWGLINSYHIVAAPTWWNKRTGTFNQEIAAAIATVDNPLVLSQKNSVLLGELISMSYYLPPETAFQVTYAPDLPQPQGERSVLLFYPSGELIQAYECATPFPGVTANLWRTDCSQP